MIVGGDNNGIIYKLSLNHGLTYNERLSKPYHCTVLKDIYLYGANLVSYLSSYQIQSLIQGESAFILSDFGMIVGMETEIAVAQYSIDMYNPDNNLIKSIYIYSGDLFSDDAISGIRYHDLKVGQYKFHNVISFQMLNFYQHEQYELSPEVFYSCHVRCVFMSDGNNLYFPGTLEVVKFEDFESDMQHNEVLDSINQATGSITGSISSASDKLSQEITGAIDDLGDEISETVEVKFDELMYGDVPYDKPEYSDDMDDINSQTDSTIDDILSNLDSKALENLPGGYLDYNSYFTDSIDTLNQTFSPAFMAVRNLFDRFVSVTDIGILLTFSLIFGFSIFVLGRSLKQ